MSFCLNETPGAQLPYRQRGKPLSYIIKLVHLFYTTVYVLWAANNNWIKLLIALLLSLAGPNDFMLPLDKVKSSLLALSQPSITLCTITNPTETQWKPLLKPECMRVFGNHYSLITGCCLDWLSYTVLIVSLKGETLTTMSLAYPVTPLDPHYRLLWLG